jgi:hypothetical protein
MAAAAIGRTPSRSFFYKHSGMNENQLLKYFDGYNNLVRAAGFEPNVGGKESRIEDATLLEDWGNVVRQLREIPTILQYKRKGNYSVTVYSRHLGPWAKIPETFREFALDKPEWADVVALLPVPKHIASHASATSADNDAVVVARTTDMRHSMLSDRPSYGNPIDFRGLRHEPVNEQGVVFLFGMVAKEMGYMVEAVQTGYPDCEAKRQVGPSNWQRVRIEFEFERRNFRDHGHPPDGCDVIVCWRHNWAECPEHLEVVELSSVIQTLSKSED